MGSLAASATSLQGFKMHLTAMMNGMEQGYIKINMEYTKIYMTLTG